MRRLLFLLLLLLSCSEKPTLLVAPHDTPEQAFLLAAEQRVTGKFHPGKNTVYFRIHLSAPAMLRAELAAVRGADTRIELLLPQGRVLYAVDDNGSSFAEEIFPLFLPAGEYLVHIAAEAQAEENFTFFYRLFKPPPDVESEPNNSLSNASAVAALHATGFFGPQFHLAGEKKEREQDCFAFSASGNGKRRAEFALTGVDGYLPTLRIFDSAGKLLVAAESLKSGEWLRTEAVAVPEDERLFVCVSAERRQKDASRDYYELHMQLADIELKSELEPNDTLATASAISGNTIEGVLTKISDIDYYFWHNPQDYAQVVRVELKSPKAPMLRLEVGENSPLRVFEDSAEKGEVADNLRVEAGEKLFVRVSCRRACPRKNFAPLSYMLELGESQATDETENEPNDSAEKAEVLVDLAQKWGFINPPGDVDFFRLSLAGPVVRDVVIESKLACRLRLEHWRAGKMLAAPAAKTKLLYNAEFFPDDLLRLTCPGTRPADRAYRLALSEP